MGRDKATIDVGGRPLISIGIDALHDAASVTVVGGPDRSTELGVPCIPDAVPGRGPLVGLLTALDRAQHDSVVVLACDLPAVSRQVVANLLYALGDADAAIPLVGGRPQWTASAWRKGARQGLARAHGQGTHSIRAAVADLRLAFLLDDDRSIMDVDTPTELEALGVSGD